MDSIIEEALEAGGPVDITTTGRKSGAPRRKEIFFHTFDGEHYISGRPGFKRDWLANLVANPRFTLHLKRGVTADLDAVAEPIRDPDERAPSSSGSSPRAGAPTPSVPAPTSTRWVTTAPLVRFTGRGRRIAAPDRGSAELEAAVAAQPLVSSVGSPLPAAPQRALPPPETDRYCRLPSCSVHHDLGHSSRDAGRQ